jgi:hypothetical protein
MSNPNGEIFWGSENSCLDSQDNGKVAMVCVASRVIVLTTRTVQKNTKNVI